MILEQHNIWRKFDNYPETSKDFYNLNTIKYNKIYFEISVKNLYVVSLTTKVKAYPVCSFDLVWIPSLIELMDYLASSLICFN